jgi:hypothetical protein
MLSIRRPARVIGPIDRRGGADRLFVRCHLEPRAKIRDAEGQGQKQVQEGHPGEGEPPELPQMHGLVTDRAVALERVAFIPVRGHVDRAADRGLVAVQIGPHSSERDDSESVMDHPMQR